MVEPQPSKLVARVRFPSPAFKEEGHTSTLERVSGDRVTSQLNITVDMA